MAIYVRKTASVDCSRVNFPFVLTTSMHTMNQIFQICLLTNYPFKFSVLKQPVILFQSSKHLCRRGREAVQVTYTLDVLSPNDDLEACTTDPPSIRGLIHLRLANVGRHSSTPFAATLVFNRKQRRFLIAPDDPSSGYGLVAAR